MSVPVNIFSNILAIDAVLPNNYVFEKRMDNDTQGNPLYLGFNITPSALTSAETWFIVKLNYDVNGFIDYVQLPNNGVGWLYSWDNRASYF